MRDLDEQQTPPGDEEEIRLARVPKDWLSKPVFTPGIQRPNREVVVNGNT